MAQRNFQSRIWSQDHDSAILEGRCTLNGSSVISGIAGNGIATITNESGTGNYSFTLSEKYRRFLFAEISVHKATSSGVMNCEITTLALDAAVQGGLPIAFTCYDKDGAAVDPVSCSFYIRVQVRLSSLKGKGE